MTLQHHPANAGHTDQPSDYYKINVFYPLIDHVVGELETRFSIQHEGLITAQNLFPLYLPKLTDKHIENIKNYFSKLSIFLTTPVESVSYEPSFSALRRLKLWTRSSMTGARLSCFAMLLIHRGRTSFPL